MSIEMQIAALQKAASEQTVASVSLAQQVSEQLVAFTQGVADVAATRALTTEQAKTMLAHLHQAKQHSQQAKYAELKTALHVEACEDTREYVDKQKDALTSLAASAEQKANEIALNVVQNQAYAAVCASIGELTEQKAKEIEFNTNTVVSLQSDIKKRSTELVSLEGRLDTLKQTVVSRVDHCDALAEQVSLDKQHAHANASLAVLAVSLLTNQQQKLITAFNALLDGTLTSAQVTQLFSE
ncbi:hypothetical protein NI389_13825 [Pseudoalteromonas xiamenensis]|uniref:hypothetical protein n=1 Tax=Pseudoalteromonas xiamenensis TaxID=882626 RepID=UPI0027E45D3B|nr:hypothetical protein [Pseudoalteromonas xiamenensis]WMN59279.1 hypothetical protein NI389_13825 [Pseudoalteromonas xiamenensis]